MRRAGSNKNLALCWGSEPPVFSIGFTTEKLFDGDSGFNLIFEDAPAPDEVAGADDPRLTWVCLNCLIEEHPQIGRGLDLAKQHGTADLWDDGEWIGRSGDLSEVDDQWPTKRIRKRRWGCI